MKHSTKAEVREAIAAIDSELARLERTHGENVDMRPWVSNDHPISLQHWGLVQRRFRLKEQLKRAGLTPEQRAARSERMKGVRQDSHNASGRPVSQSQIDDRPSGEPSVPPRRFTTGTFAF
jgi:hypothetical protein